MSFVIAEKTRRIFEESVVKGIHVYGDTKIELDGAVKLNWPSVTRRLVLEYGLCKIAIPYSSLCVAFAGNHLWYVHKLFSWMADNSPFEVQEFIERAYELHLAAESRDDIEFIICDTESSKTGRITCIKNGRVLDDQVNAWIGSPLTFCELQKMRIDALEGGRSESPGTLSLFSNAVSSSADDSVGGFTIDVALLDGEFHYNDYLYTQVYKPRLVHPGESVQLFDTKEDGGYTIEAFEADGCPALSFPQIGKTLVYTNKYRYPDGALSVEGLSYFYLPMLFDSRTGAPIEP